MTSAMWTEKYRPENFEDIYGQEQIVKRVRAFVEQKNMPHLLFSGPAGIGKTSLALVITKQLFHQGWHQNFLELNASDERGIDIIRNKVKDFARTRAIGDVPFKIIYLDESDALTKEAQQALRRTMENYTKTCRFILSCNYSSKIIDPIQSRCAVFHFKPLKKEAVVDFLKKLISNENVVLGQNDDENQKIIDTLTDISGGDMRRILNILQSCAAISSNNKLSLEDIYSIASVARPKEIKEVLTLALNQKFIDSRNKLIDTMLQHGLSGLDIIKQIQKEVWNLEIPDNLKVQLTSQCGETEFHMVEGSDEFVQLESFLAFVQLNSNSP